MNSRALSLRRGRRRTELSHSPPPPYIKDARKCSTRAGGLLLKHACLVNITLALLVKPRSWLINIRPRTLHVVHANHITRSNSSLPRRNCSDFVLLCHAESAGPYRHHNCWLHVPGGVLLQGLFSIE